MLAVRPHPAQFACGRAMPPSARSLRRSRRVRASNRRRSGGQHRSRRGRWGATLSAPSPRPRTDTAGRLDRAGNPPKRGRLQHCGGRRNRHRRRRKVAVLRRLPQLHRERGRRIFARAACRRHHGGHILGEIGEVANGSKAGRCSPPATSRSTNPSASRRKTWQPRIYVLEGARCRRRPDGRLLARRKAHDLPSCPPPPRSWPPAPISPLRTRTPLVAADADLPRRHIYLKLENLQPWGSFKIRAAVNALKTRMRRGCSAAC
jgi:hypothetical protein